MRSPELRINRTDEADVIELELAGEIVAKTIPQLARIVDTLPCDGRVHLRFEMSGVDRIDSRGIGALVGWHQHFAVEEGELRLLNVTEGVMKVLRLLNLNNLLLIGPCPADRVGQVRRHRERLWRAHEYGEQVIAALGEGLLGLDTSGAILFVNPPAQEMFGLNELEVLGRPFRDTFRLFEPPDSAASASQIPLEKLFGGAEGQYRAELSIGWVKGRAALTVDAIATPIKIDGTWVGSIVGLRDVSERKRIERERETLRTKLILAEKLESLGSLAGGIAHEFNNLLIGVLGHAEFALCDLPPDSPVRHQIEAIESNADRMRHFTSKMLAYSGRGRMETQPLNLSSFVGEAREELAKSFPANVELKIEAAEDLPLVSGEPTQIGRILNNLVANAVESIGEAVGSVTIRTGSLAADRPLLASTYLDEDLPEAEYAFIEIRDTGMGIADEDRPKIFEPFFTTKFVGRGLGLAEVWGIVRGHRGAIKVQSEQGVGTTVTVLFPVHVPIEAPAKVAARGGVEKTGKGTILIVDDEETVRDLAMTALENQGYEVLTAADGREGVELFARHAAQIVAVILDMMMPGMDGKEAFGRIREIDSEARIILSSGYDEEEATSGYAHEGPAGFLQKPYRPSDLARKVGDIIAS